MLDPFNAPGYGQIVAVNVAYGFAKASPASALCTYSFAAVPGDTLRHCAGGSFSDAIATSGANWVELGLYNEGNTGIAITTARANNAAYAGGWVTISDPTQPEVWANGPTGVQSGLTALLDWAASDSESGAPAVSYAIDGGARVALRGQACSWICGTLASGSTALDLSALAEGPHAVTVYAKSFADVESGYGPFAFHARPHGTRVAARPRRARSGRRHGLRAGPCADRGVGFYGQGPDVVYSIMRVHGPSGVLVNEQAFAVRADRHLDTRGRAGSPTVRTSSTSPSATAPAIA